MPASSPIQGFWRGRQRDPEPDSGRTFEAPDIPKKKKDLLD